MSTAPAQRYGAAGQARLGQTTPAVRAPAHSCACSAQMWLHALGAGGCFLFLSGPSRLVSERSLWQLAARAVLEQRLCEQRLDRLPGARLNPAKSRLQRGGAPERAAFRGGYVPGRKRLTVVAIADDAADPAELHTPYVRFNLFNAVVHGTLPQKNIPAFSLMT